MANEEIFLYYFILILGVFIVSVALFTFVAMYRNKNYTILNVGKCLGSFLFGVLILALTLPSLKYFVLKEYDVVKGKCVIDVDSSGRTSVADFTMLDSDEIFIFRDIPELDAYGKSIPYYCEVTVTEDHMFEINYKIYDVKSRKLILSSK